MVRRFVRLPAHDRGLLVRAVLTLATARLVVWVLPFRVGRRLLTRPPRAPRGGITGDRVRWAIHHAQRVVPRATCVPQALAAERLLGRGGLPADLHIGVRKSPAGKFEAHAWVESEGRIVVGDLPGGLGDWARLPKLPSPWATADAAPRTPT